MQRKGRPMDDSATNSTGNRILDAQHIKLLRLCRAAEACLEGDRRGAVARLQDALHDLALYANEHFRTEEQILLDAGYPFMDALREEHVEYQQALASLFLEAQPDPQRLRAWLSHWWRQHLQADRELTQFLAEHQHTGSASRASRPPGAPRTGRTKSVGEAAGGPQQKAARTLE